MNRPDANAAPGAPARIAGRERVALRDPVFISDLHLSTQRPQTLRRFFAFLADVAGTAAELVILGDLFEYWVGDDTLAQPCSDPEDQVGRDVARALQDLAAGGTASFLLHGNRDVLLGAGFLQASGAQLLADPAIATIETDGAQLVTLLSHGDAYCTRDVAYQDFRRQAHSEAFQAAFLARPLEQRRALVGQARVQSDAAKRQMAMEIMDVTPEAIAQALRAAGTHHIIHGHTHRPARHDFVLDGEPAVRWVLPDWDQDAVPPRGGGLRRRGRTVQSFDL